MADQFIGTDGVNYAWLDSDTITDGITSYRLSGFNALENPKAVQDDNEGPVKFIQGQVGGDEQTKATKRIAELGGFNNVEISDEVDNYGRKIVSLKDQYGNDLSNALLRSGAIDIDKYTTEVGLRAAQAGEMERASGISNQYTDIANQEITKKPIFMKDTPLLEQAFGEGPIDENGYAQQVIRVVAAQNGLNINDPDQLRAATKIIDSGVYDKRSVAFENLNFRNPDRTKEGVAYDQMTTAWNQGWGGLATGWAGFGELSGVLVGTETISKWARDKVEIAKEELREEPRLLSMDYRDIDTVWDGFRFMSNNMAMSAPYLVTLASGALLSPLTGGASLVAAVGSVGGSYAGQVWNDIEGPKGRVEAGGAILAGTIMATLDYIGMRGLLPVSAFLTPAGRKLVIDAMMKETGKEGLKYANREAAQAAFNAASRRSIRETIDGIGNFALINVAKPNLIKEMAKGSVRGSLSEGITEASQEATGYIASKAMSEGGLEKNFDIAEFKNLLAQSAVAGGSLGASFGTAGALFREGQNQILRNDLKKGDTNKLNEFGQIRDANTRGTSESTETIIGRNKQGVMDTQEETSPTTRVDRKRMSEEILTKATDKSLTEQFNTIQDKITSLMLEQKNTTDPTEQLRINDELEDLRQQREKIKYEQRVRDLGDSMLTDEEYEKEKKLMLEQIEEDKNNRIFGKDNPNNPNRRKKVNNRTKADSLLSQLEESGRKRKKQERKDDSFWSKLKNFRKYIPLFYRASSTSAFTPARMRVSKVIREMSALIGNALGNMFSGVDVEGFKSILRSRILGKLNPRGIFKMFKLMDRPSNSKYISNLIREYYKSRQAGTPYSQEVQANMEAILYTINNLNQAQQAIYDAEFELEILDNPTFKKQVVNFDNPQWLASSSFDWRKVRQYKAEWFAFMRKYGVAPDGGRYLDAELDILYNKISNQDDASDFSLVGGAMWRPNQYRTKDGKLLSSLPEFDRFANNDIIQNTIRAVDQHAKYFAYTRYFGRGGQDLDYMFLRLEQEGELSKEEMEEVAIYVKDIIDAGTGNFNPIKNKQLSYWQRKASFISAMIGLGLSMLASIPESVMLLYQGPNGKVVRDGIVKAIKEMIQIFKNVEAMEIDPALEDIPGSPKDSKGQQRLTRGGLFDDDAVAATRLGMGETDIAQAWWMKWFFKLTGIAPFTTVQRMFAASQVAGSVSSMLRILAAIPLDDVTGKPVPMNQRQMEVYNQLLDIGMDVDAMVELYRKYDGNQEMFDLLYDPTYENMSPAEIKEYASDMDFIQRQMSIATWYYTNARVQNPQAFNRPLLLQDPHYQLFFQFNGFISVFTATIIPRLWLEYIKNGSPRMKYNTFALIVLMMALAGVSQWLKDYIKFQGSSPYLNDFQLVQRAIMASGVLGSGERVLQAAYPLYKSRNENFTDRLFGETVGGAPVVRNIITAGRAIGNLLDGDTRRFTREVTKITPGIASVTPARNIINQIIHGDKIKPYN